ncbi:alanine/glycine:cation symporter family protein [Oceanobacillus sp. M65]|jgi:alanine or glycine:cation symporter, AGCS family|uniref:Sodium:alanine symporter family protein n=1 Tax=Oceanobacillus jordanicus TaxID=2867266 RepID=A0AAW5B7E4_9BACI|nr:sodium:alanine symporter family protein [Oceanobacillus jordanicus]AVQ98259.1 sodium:alanine symporter family protein [Oceanobacillus iheyensis]MCG3419915.1 sodium:alanine symporter family protein [Oceanobacillus jordanicus]
MEEIISSISDIVWGPPMLILIVGAGLYLTLRLGFLQFRTLPYALKLAFSPARQDKKSKGDISHYQALTTAMAATIGTGNIVGVATAVVLGGPGAVLWMWVTALLGMATKYSEAILAVKYRQVNSKGEISGGPMYYLEKGLKAKWLGVLFAIFGSCAAFGIGNMVQSNSVSKAMSDSFNVPTWVTGILLTVLVGLVILGGIKSIGRVTSFFVPIMAAFYVLGGLIIMILNFDLVPQAVGIIFNDAFTGSAIGGGILGTVIRYGVARGVFSNEAGLGSAPIAAAAAKTDLPGRQALVSMTQVFIDTIIVCSITGITIVMADMYGGGLEGGELTSASFAAFLGDTGGYIVTIGIVLFAFSTLVGWSYYGEKCFSYLFSDKAVPYYRVVFVAAVMYGALEELSVVFGISDIMNALMAAPNIIGLVGLSGVVVYETKRFLKVAKEEKLQDKERKARVG